MQTETKIDSEIKCVKVVK